MVGIRTLSLAALVSLAVASPIMKVRDAAPTETSIPISDQQLGAIFNAPNIDAALKDIEEGVPLPASDYDTSPPPTTTTSSPPDYDYYKVKRQYDYDYDYDQPAPPVSTAPTAPPYDYDPPAPPPVSTDSPYGYYKGKRQYDYDYDQPASPVSTASPYDYDPPVPPPVSTDSPYGYYKSKRANMERQGNVTPNEDDDIAEVFATLEAITAEEAADGDLQTSYKSK